MAHLFDSLRRFLKDDLVLYGVMTENLDPDTIVALANLTKDLTSKFHEFHLACLNFGRPRSWVIPTLDFFQQNVDGKP